MASGENSTTCLRNRIAYRVIEVIVPVKPGHDAHALADRASESIRDLLAATLIL